MKTNTNYIWKYIHSSISPEILPTKMVSISSLDSQIKYNSKSSKVISRLIGDNEVKSLKKMEFNIINNN